MNNYYILLKVDEEKYLTHYNEFGNDIPSYSVHAYKAIKFIHKSDVLRRKKEFEQKYNCPFKICEVILNIKILE
ncbi:MULTISPECIES: hypothetical protein [unclassified Clostridium]|uniref:hypothetical protein n=1 Tax=unclassified Clostridium TaxID=2614128 RepID=UPI0025C1CCF2|nr:MULTISPECIES: hypothetical protein [unclassified Clostridium]